MYARHWFFSIFKVNSCSTNHDEFDESFYSTWIWVSNIGGWKVIAAEDSYPNRWYSKVEVNNMDENVYRIIKGVRKYEGIFQTSRR